MHTEVKLEHLLPFRKVFSVIPCFNNAKMSPSSDKTAATVASALISLASARLAVVSSLSSVLVFRDAKGANGFDCAKTL